MHTFASLKGPGAGLQVQFDLVPSRTSLVPFCISSLPSIESATSSGFRWVPTGSSMDFCLSKQWSWASLHTTQIMEGLDLKELRATFFVSEALEKFSRDCIGFDWVSSIINQIVVSRGMRPNRIFGFRQSESTLKSWGKDRYHKN